VPHRLVGRRVKWSRLQVRPGIDGFHFQHHKSRSRNKTRILRLLDLSFLANGTKLVLIGNPGVRKTLLTPLVAAPAPPVTVSPASHGDGGL